MTWEGKPYAPTRPGEAIETGIGLIHQEMRLLPDLSIAENVFVGRLLMKGGRIDRETMNQRAAEQLRTARPGRLANDPRSDLKGRRAATGRNRQSPHAQSEALDSG